MSLWSDPKRLSYAFSRHGVILVMLELQLVMRDRISNSTVKAFIVLGFIGSYDFVDV